MHTTHHHPNDRRGTAASTTEITGWLCGALPPDLYRSVPAVEVDADEILVVGDVGAAELPAGLDAEGTAAAERARIARFREETRDRRIAVARQAEARYGRPVSWGATSGATTEHFTTARVVVGTRLGLEHRKVLDRLVAAGIARHRGEALAWCVALVETNEDAWLARLQEALGTLHQTVSEAPGTASPEA